MRRTPFPGRAPGSRRRAPSGVRGAAPRLSSSALIVDDDPLGRERYARALEGAGFRVGYAGDGRRGLREIRSGGYRVALLDAVLPLMDGFAVLAALKRAGRTHPPVVLLSNLGRREDIERANALGAAGCITKATATPAEILRTVRRAIGQHPERPARGE